MDNTVKFNAENINISDIMRQIHENLKTRGYDINELKKLKHGVAGASPNTYSSLNERLDENVHQANLTYFVRYWWPMKRGLTPLSFIKNIIKKVVRKLCYFYFRHVINQQVIFNTNIVKSINDLSEYCKKLEYEKCELINRLDEIQSTQRELIQKAERLEDSKKSKASNGFSEKLCYDYNRFEEEYRGSFEDIKERQRQYLEHFNGCQSVIDIGCGRGEFLTLLKENHIGALGLDLVDKNIELCIDSGLNATFGNGVDYLKGLSNESIDGIFAAQVIEHMSTEVLIRLIDTAYDKLKPNSCIVLETLNPQCLMIYAQCMYLDPTHSTPVHPEAVKFFMKSAGFENIEIRYFSPTDQSFWLPHIKAMPEADKSVDIINHLLFGCREYAIIARK